VSAAQGYGLSFPLRSGETCALQTDALTVGQRQIPLREIVAAGLVADLSVPVAPGMPPTPGVSLRLNDGSSAAFTPVEQLDCWRLLQALAVARPGVVTPPPPPGAQGYGYGPTHTPGYPPPMLRMASPSESDKTLAGLCHLSVFFAPVILPLIIWLAMRQSQPYASQQAKQAFWFHLFFAALAFLAGAALQFFFFSSFFSAASAGAPPDPIGIDLSILPGVFVFYGLLIIFGLTNAIFSVIAAIQAFQGKPFHYPGLGWLAR
jgi:uncharacterized Tic20 family protein